MFQNVSFVHEVYVEEFATLLADKGLPEPLPGWKCNFIRVILSLFITNVSMI